MQEEVSVQNMIQARGAGLRKLNRVTAGVAVSAFAGMGLIAAVGALSIPGASPLALATCVPATTTQIITESDETNSDDSNSSSTTGLGTPCVVGSSKGTAVAVSGGSHPH
jgi:hypothetical protein